jgi:adenylosuccinate synthase
VPPLPAWALGFLRKHIDKVLGITKAYCTRVGTGPFPTELFDNDGETLQKEGHEFGATTGRRRRCGWLDLVALRYAIHVGGIDRLVLTKLDVLSGFETLKVCTHYKVGDSQVENYSMMSSTIEALSLFIVRSLGGRLTSVRHSP